MFTRKLLKKIMDKCILGMECTKGCTMNFLTVKEVSNILKVSPRTVANMIRSGKIRAVEISGFQRKTFRVYEKEIDRFMAQNYERQIDK